MFILHSSSAHAIGGEILYFPGDQVTGLKQLRKRHQTQWFAPI